MSDGFVVNDAEWAEELETSVEGYTDMLLEALWDSGTETIDSTVSGNLFCGCSACFWRETLFFLVPRIIRGYEEGKIELED